MPDAPSDARRAETVIAQRLVQLFTETAIKQKLPMDAVAEAMLVEAIALLGAVGSGRRDLAGLLRKAADALDAQAARKNGVS